MSRLEDLQPNAAIRGILPDTLVTVVSVQWFGSEALELTYKTATGKVANELLYRHDEPRIALVEQGRPWSFDGDGALFRLVSEAQRIRLAHLFDPVLAVHTSVVEPLPHQITAVYESMLPRQPLRFLLADDPGAGKTIMAGLFIKELIARGDLQRCLIVCPGSLAEQWQDELYRRFHLPFEILTNDKLEAARTGNWFLEANLVIARLDKLARNEDVQQKLQAPDCRWDLVICDEAHKMSATVFGGETKYTKRYRLGQLLSTLTRHFLLMSATPHNGKEEDFQLFMALLDGDRFEGRFRDGVHVADTSDMMRRMVKEGLLKFDGTPLFPQRIAYTVPYKLSEAEAHLYKAVTDYVREEFNRADALKSEADQLQMKERIAQAKDIDEAVSKNKVEIDELKKAIADAMEIINKSGAEKNVKLRALQVNQNIFNTRKSACDDMEKQYNPRLKDHAKAGEAWRSMWDAKYIGTIKQFSNGSVYVESDSTQVAAKFNAAAKEAQEKNLIIIQLQKEIETQDENAIVDRYSHYYRVPVLAGHGQCPAAENFHGQHDAAARPAHSGLGLGGPGRGRDRGAGRQAGHGQGRREGRVGGRTARDEEGREPGTDRDRQERRYAEERHRWRHLALFRPIQHGDAPGLMPGRGGGHRGR